MLREKTMKEEQYTFENFFAVGVNEEAKAQAIAFAKGDTKSSVLVLSGSAGVGKTHLAYAIVNAIKKLNVDKFVMTFSFVDDICNWFRNPEKYATETVFEPNSLNDKAAVILIIGFNPSSAEEEAAKLLSALRNLKTNIILTTNEDLKIDIEHEHIKILPSTIKTQLQIIKHTFHQIGTSFSDDLIDLLSCLYFRNNREMQNMIVTLSAMQNLYKDEINRDFIMRLYEESYR